MTVQHTVLLKVLSGPHRGAELELAPGDWTMGADAVCDLVLSDPDVSAEHLSLRVDGNIHLSPLHGALVTLNGVPVPAEGVELSDYAVFQLGGTHVCIGSGGEEWPENVLSPSAEATIPSEKPEADADNGADAELSPTPPPASANEPLSMTPGADASTAAIDTPDSGRQRSAVRETIQGHTAHLETAVFALAKKPRSHGKSWLALLLVLVLLTVLITGTSWMGLFGPSQEGQLALVQQALRDGGFTTFQAETTPQGQVLVTGVVALVADKTRVETLLHALEGVRFAQVRITEVETLARELRTTFEQAGARLRVDRTGVRLRISGYIHDQEQLGLLLEPHMHALSEVSLKLGPVFWGDLEPELKRIIAARQLQNVIRFAPSLFYVTVETRQLSQTQREALAQLDAEITDITQGISPFERTTEPGRAPAPAPARPRTEPAAPLPLCQRLEFVPGGVKLDGTTYREGGRLPGGYRISELAETYVVFVTEGNNMLICRKRQQGDV